MRWTTEMLAEELPNFSGGQLEIQNKIKGYHLRGEIQAARATGDELEVIFKWLARSENDRWVKDSRIKYLVSLFLANSVDVGTEPETGLERICFNLLVSNELILFIPPGAKSRLNLKEVAGLTA